MYRVKEHGRNSYRFYTPEMTRDAQERIKIEMLLRRALDNLLDNAAKYAPPGTTISIRGIRDQGNVSLQILDEGKINDAQGRTVDFSNTVICMTSNAGSSNQVNSVGFGHTVNEQSRGKPRGATSSSCPARPCGRP